MVQDFLDSIDQVEEEENSTKIDHPGNSTNHQFPEFSLWVALIPYPIIADQSHLRQGPKARDALVKFDSMYIDEGGKITECLCSGELDSYNTHSRREY